MTSDSHYDRRHLKAFSTIGRGQAELAERFFGYYGAVFNEGAMSVREKALTALAVAHAVQCPYCIDAYTSGSLEKGSDLDQMTEAVHVAAAVRSASVMSYGVQMFGQATRAQMGPDGATVSPSYFDRRHRAERDGVIDAVSKLGQKFRDWQDAVFTEGALSEREKHLVGLACAHALQCPYEIERHSQALTDRGVALEPMTEAVHVANAIRGGAALVHGIQMLEQVDRTSK